MNQITLERLPGPCVVRQIIIEYSTTPSMWQVTKLNTFTIQCVEMLDTMCSRILITHAAKVPLEPQKTPKPPKCSCDAVRRPDMGSHTIPKRTTSGLNEKDCEPQFRKSTFRAGGE